MRVSIPQGTIKSEIFIFKFFPSFVFQFHKVRLKDSAHPLYRVKNSKFQFHKVRLKENEKRKCVSET